MTVSFAGLNEGYLAHEQEYNEIFKRVLRSGVMFQGNETAYFEELIANYTGRNYAVATGSGTDALYFALKALNYRGEVSVPDLSFVASASSILRAGASPRFVEVNDYGLLQWTKLRPGADALVYVHLYGLMHPNSLWMAEETAGYFIEDAAQALGARCQYHKAGSLGIVSCISFDPMKNLPSPTGGGVILTDEPEIAFRVRGYRYHSRSLDYKVVGYNSQMSELAAATLSFSLQYLDEWNEKRRSVANAYRVGFQDNTLLQLPYFPQEEASCNWHKFPIRTRHRDRLKLYLDRVGIPTKIHYPYVLHRMGMFRDSQPYVHETDYSKALEIAGTTLSLPIHPFLQSDQVENIIEEVNSFLRSCAE